MKRSLRGLFRGAAARAQEHGQEIGIGGAVKGVFRVHGGFTAASVTGMDAAYIVSSALFSEGCVLRRFGLCYTHIY
ncbi:MAG: hypothetical protein BroJett038_09840 [Chloroflexota bacterium]|nr:MAG: hypothetical protein BroJett038_09840 [Chloroflexota bacterium]